MTQKNKVKELVGRGLNSYHTKSLQQIDRIEKKNKEQNHKISILSNELDNDYLTKTEEGSVISLEHSKEGMVYLDELQGNTLVNYCTDGSKEMTLNGDIDVEGVSVTTTEGVDNGKVDVLCEGNTLVNLSPNTFEIGCPDEESTKTFWFSGEYINNSLFKPNTEYSVIFYNKHPEVVRAYFHLGEPTAKDLVNNMAVFTTPSTITTDKNIIHFYTNNNLSKQQIEQSNMKVVILEGDWTNKEIPPYFEGMKSVGQDDINGHKIEILSRNKNHVLSKPKTVVQDVVSHDIYLEPNKEYSISSNVPYNSGLCMISKNHSNTNPIFTFQNWGETVNKFTTPNNLEKGIYSLVFWKSQLSADDNSWTQVELGKTITNYIPYNSNKKEILINEPLRAVDNVKDKFVKIGNKYFIERNCAEVCLDGSKIPHMNDEWLTENQCVFHVSNIIHGREPHTVISNSFKAGSVINTNQNIECIQIGGSGVPYTNVYVKINKSRLTTVNSEGVKTYLQANPIRLVYILATPTYEPVQIEPVLNTYNDITHISNNSIIPCNMKIKNTGYNAIIKPSTLYTVALDTNKSGTIGMNLGGTKVTTTNNVATITTPATLTDDSLRLYGKGIKGSKVRLLEGDKTNWIPSHFEGMKSSFEDKLQDDDTYKMEILSNNKNLFNSLKEPDYTGGDMRYYSGYGGLFKRIENKEYILGNYGGMAFILNLPKNKTYKISIKVRNSNGSNTKVQSVIFLNKEGIGNTESTFTTNVTENVIGFGVVNYNEDTDLILYDVILSEVIDEYTERKSNKIQFSSIEPLRKWDRFVFKDGQLMIERNTKELIVDNSLNWVGFDTSVTPKNPRAYFIITDCIYDEHNRYGICKDFTLEYSDRDFKHFKMHQFSGNADHTICWFYVPKNELTEQNQLGFKEYMRTNPTKLIYQLKEPTYEEIPFELQKIILEGYENGTLFIDTNIPPTVTTTYAGETPIVKSVKLNKTEVLNNTEDINDNIIPYLMDMDYRVVCLQLQSEEFNDGVSMARLFGGAYEMLKRDILSKRLTREEYGHRLADYFNAGKLTEEQVRELEDLR